MLAPLVIILVLGSCYARTIAPDLTWAHFSADGGDLITAAATGGVPHPGGYPLYLLLARLFQFIPVGSLAFRTNLLSVVCSIIASLLLYAFLARALSPRPHTRTSALLGALVYGTLPLTWGQALVTEVYALHGMMVIICLFLLDSNSSPRHSLVLGLVFGLSASNHLTSLFLLPLLALGAGEKTLAAPSSLLQRSLGVIAGLSLYLLLPVRALSNPPVNWGNSSTLSGFVWLVTGQAYRTYAFSLSLAEIFQRLRAASGLFIDQFTIVGVLLVIYGLLSHLPRKLMLATGWTSLAFFLFAVLYSPLDSQVYLLPVWLCLTIWLTFGIQDLIDYLSAYPRFQKGLTFLLFAGLLVRIAFVLPSVDASHDTRADDFIANISSHTPTNAIIFASDDEQIFSLWYMRFALNQRTDIIVVAEGLLQFEWYRDNLRYTYPKLTVPEKNNLTPFNLVTANPERIICFTSRDKPLQCS